MMTREWGENATSEKTCGEVDQRRQDWEQHVPSKVLEEPRGQAAGAGVCPGPGRAAQGGKAGGGQACSEAGPEGEGRAAGPCAVRSRQAQCQLERRAWVGRAFGQGWSSVRGAGGQEVFL